MKKSFALGLVSGLIVAVMLAAAPPAPAPAAAPAAAPAVQTGANELLIQEPGGAVIARVSEAGLVKVAAGSTCEDALRVINVEFRRMAFAAEQARAKVEPKTAPAAPQVKP